MIKVPLSVTKAVQLTAMMIALTWNLKRSTHTHTHLSRQDIFYQLPRNAVVVIFASQHSRTQYTQQRTARWLLYGKFFLSLMFIHSRPESDSSALCWRANSYYRPNGWAYNWKLTKEFKRGSSIQIEWLQLLQMIMTRGSRWNFHCFHFRLLACLHPKPQIS